MSANPFHPYHCKVPSNRKASLSRKRQFINAPWCQAQLIAMPQSRPKDSQNWLLNPRVPPPTNTLRLDNSKAKLDNWLLEAQLNRRLNTMDDAKFRKKADQKHAMLSAKKSAQVVFAQAKPSVRIEATSLSSSQTPKSPIVPSSSSSDGSDDSEVEEPPISSASRFPVTFSSRPASSAAGRAPLPGISRPLSSQRESSRSGGLCASRRPRTVAGPRVSSRPSTRASNERSFQQMRDMAQMDIATRTKMNDARQRALAVMAEQRREEEKLLQLRLTRFYTDLDGFIKKTKEAQESSNFGIREQRHSFLVDLSKLKISCGVNKDS